MFGRVRRWLERHRVLVDAVVLAPFLVLILVAGIADVTSGNDSDPSPAAYAAFTLALLLPLVVRRRYPVVVFAFIAAAAFLQWVFRVDVIPADLAVVLAMYTVVAHRKLAWAAAALAVTELGLALMAIRYQPTEDFGNTLFGSTFFVLVFWVTGLYRNTRRSYLAGLEERAERLERERDAQAQVAVAEERARIARELHDVVAHNVSVMVVQADGAAFAVDTDPARAKGAVETISSTGRTALAEMRRLLGILRESSGDEQYTPQPGVGQLVEVVEQMRVAGLRVDFEIETAAHDIPSSVQLACYRVIQESLTNTLKHGGPRAAAAVRLGHRDGMLEIRVADDGRGVAVPSDGGGHGLIGMRERMAMHGGTVTAGPRVGGGFEVVAQLPLATAVSP